MISRKSKPVRLVDVARAAHVSISTVSRALASPLQVNDATAERVKRVAERLGYIARNPTGPVIRGKTRTIGAIFPDLDNGIFSITAHALQKTLASHGYMLVIACSDYSLESELEVGKTLLERGVDGIVLTGIEHDGTLLPMYAKAGVPVVCTWAYRPGAPYTCVGLNNRKAGALIAHHMAQLGHRKIAVIQAYTALTERHAERLAGIREALESRGLSLPDELVVQSKLAYETGKEGVRKLFAYGDPPTALICSNDIIAMGAMAECHDMGLGIPDDVSISGFEDLAIASHVRPALTTIRWSQVELGRLAGEAIVGELSRRDVGARQIEIPVELIVRATTASPGSLRDVPEASATASSLA